MLPQPRRRNVLIAGASLLAVATVYALAMRLTFGEWQYAAQFGDSFGGLNAFFTGAALLGAIFAILLQAHELRLQREELVLQRKELQENREEQARQSRAQEGFRRALLLSAQIEATKLETEEYRNISQGLPEESRESYHRALKLIRSELEESMASERLPDDR